MARPLSYQQFIAALKGAGLKVVEVRTDGKSPERHNRNHVGPWGDVHGVMIHHTVTKGTDRTVEICRKGYVGLPGPLCHGVIAKDGTVYVVGYGRTNHAGKGDRDVFNAVVRESYKTSPPAANQAVMDGNPHFYGFECENLGDGKDPWPFPQLDAMERASAALCKAHGWTEKSVIGHKEWQPGKVDPRGFSMTTMRSAVREVLHPTPRPKPAPPKPKPTPAPAPSRDDQQDARLDALEDKLEELDRN
jgi:hypothetical protein